MRPLKTLINKNYFDLEKRKKNLQLPYFQKIKEKRYLFHFQTFQEFKQN